MALQRADHRSATDYVLFMMAWLGLAIASFAVKHLPFRMLMRGMAATPRWTVPVATQVQVIRAVSRAASRSPWRSACIEQGMVAHRLLRRCGLPSQFVYGLRTAGEALEAHVWLRVDGEVVLGGESMAGFREVLAIPR